MKKLFFIAMLAMFGCYENSNNKDLNCLYRGAHVMDIRRVGGSIWYEIKYKGEIFYVDVSKVYDTYQIGDTINKTCLE